MTPALTDRDRRALALGGFVLFAAILLRIWSPMAAVLTHRAELNQSLSDRLVWLHQRETQPTAVRAELVRVERRLARLDSLLLPSGSPAHVSSELHAIVRDAAEAAGLVLISSTSLPDSVPTGPLQKAIVRLEAHGDVSGVLQFLLLIELAPGLLDVRQLAIAAEDPAGAPDSPESLRVSLAIEGAALAPGVTR